jgi:Fe-S cluster assembly scaffold protein SufB
MHYTSSAAPVSNAIQSRNLVLVEQGSTAHVIESYTSECEVDEFTNHVSEVVVGQQCLFQLL